MIITIFRFMNCESVTNLFIVNLSIGDILVIGFALPFRVSCLFIKMFLVVVVVNHYSIILHLL